MNEHSSPYPKGFWKTTKKKIKEPSFPNSTDKQKTADNRYRVDAYGVKKRIK
jgi:hypothetical protein